MRIKAVEIENFRSAKHLVCDFGAVTSLIGPNGAGKSNILRALDWFFNGIKDSLSADDVHRGAVDDHETGPRIRVRVDFEDLTDEDREALGPRYCPDAGTTTFTAWRSWQNGGDKITAKAFAYPAFEAVRACTSAGDKRAAYNEVRAGDPTLGLPSCSSAAAVEDAMNAWERDHPDLLAEAEVSDTHFFGIGGQGKLGELFDFVFVSADLRATEETSSARDSLISRILQRAVMRDSFDTATAALAAEFARKYDELADEHLSEQLGDLAAELSTEISNYSLGRSIHLRQGQAQMKPTPAAVMVQVAELSTETPVNLQGHGFQRTLLLAALTVLSRRKRAAQGAGQMFLAIEEPELFQHPTQARAFASVLRSIATDREQKTQVAYATHSPHFVHPAYFDEVRRISTVRATGSDYTYARVTQATVDGAEQALAGFLAAKTLARRWDQVCLKYLPEALFAEGVILVEGDEDAAILEGVGGRVNDLAVSGYCVAPVSGKSNMYIPFAILKLLGVPTLMVVDNDSGCAERMRKIGRPEDKVAEAVEANKASNRKLCRFVGANEEDYPTGSVGANLVFVPDTLETLLASELPGWDLTRKEVIEQGRGVEGKNAATYALAARECQGEPGEHLARILNFCSPAAA
ncbi:ATP-dependent nuclease [Nocardioides daejeonensis]|uniref:ATP-dependent nuclease n=1 Tax=Nocardioides daejeonensis TaxID=1046556 RepID=UPI0013A53E9F|nr:AAA family ATPase [Nocardioides daejeonensis]